MNNSYDNMNNRGSSGHNTSGCGCDNHNVPGPAGVALGYGDFYALTITPLAVGY